MRVAINCRSFLKKQYTGIGRYAFHLVKSLSEIDRENDYQLYASKGLLSFGKRLPQFDAMNFTPRIDWFNRGPSRSLKNVDLYHAPSPEIIDIPENAKCIVTVHDLIFKAYPTGHTSETIEAGERQFEQIRSKADKIICCSNSTVKDLKKFFNVPDGKIAMVYQGVDKNTFHRLDKDEEWIADQMLGKMGIKAPFILSVGTIEPRKNIPNLIQAFHRIRLEGKFLGDLVIVGMKGWMKDNIEALVDQLELAEHVKYLGYISDRELCNLYNTAEVFVFPSYYEGFGFPIIEAFCCGVPVVTSNSSSCPEVAGDAALTVSPGSPAEIADAITRILQDEKLRGELADKGLQRAAQFDFRKTAAETLEVYRQVHQV